jgi:hypothetical protein
MSLKLKISLKGSHFEDIQSNVMTVLEVLKEKHCQQSGHDGEEKNSQPLPGLEPPVIQPVAQCYTTDLSWLLPYSVNISDNILLFFFFYRLNPVNCQTSYIVAYSR